MTKQDRLLCWSGPLAAYTWVSSITCTIQAAEATAHRATTALAACEEEQNRLAHGSAALQRQLNEQQLAAEELRQQVRRARRANFVHVGTVLVDTVLTNMQRQVQKQHLHVPP